MQDEASQLEKDVKQLESGEMSRAAVELYISKQKKLEQLQQQIPLLAQEIKSRTRRNEAQKAWRNQKRNTKPTGESGFVYQSEDEEEPEEKLTDKRTQQ